MFVPLWTKCRYRYTDYYMNHEVHRTKPVYRCKISSCWFLATNKETRTNCKSTFLLKHKCCQLQNKHAAELATERRLYKKFTSQAFAFDLGPHSRNESKQKSYLHALTLWAGNKHILYFSASTSNSCILAASVTNYLLRELQHKYIFGYSSNKLWN